MCRRKVSVCVCGRITGPETGTVVLDYLEIVMLGGMALSRSSMICKAPGDSWAPWVCWTGDSLSKTPNSCC